MTGRHATAGSGRFQFFDADLGAVAVHGRRVDGDVDGRTFFDGLEADHLRLVQQRREPVFEFDEGADQVSSFAVVVLLGGETDDRGVHAVTDLQGSNLFAQAGVGLLLGADDLAVHDLVFVEDDAGARRAGLARLFFALGCGHASFFDEHFERHAGGGDQQVAMFGFGRIVLAGEETVGDEAVGIAFDGHDHAGFGVVGDVSDSALDGGAGGDGDGGCASRFLAGTGSAGSGSAGGVQDRSFQIVDCL